MISGGFMKRKYIELNSSNIEKYRANARWYLSYFIGSKEDDIRYSNYYKKKLNGVNKELSDVLKEIDKLINEINELNKRISALEKGRALVAYNHNLLLGNNNKSKINKINDARYYYCEIIDELNKLTRYRDELRNKLNDYKNSKRELMLQKNRYSRILNTCVGNAEKCNYNIENCYKVLNRIDDICFHKIDKVPESYFIPKAKKLKY